MITGTIKQMIQNAPQNTELKEATVIAVSPLQFQLKSNERLVLDEDDVTIPKRIVGTLEEGNEVMLIAYMQGQKFYLLDVI